MCGPLTVSRGETLSPSFARGRAAVDLGGPRRARARRLYRAQHARKWPPAHRGRRENEFGGRRGDGVPETYRPPAGLRRPALALTKPPVAGPVQPYTAPRADTYRT